MFNALGIFGRLDAAQEAHFLALQERYHPLAENSEAFGVFPHLTLVASYKVPSANLPLYMELLERLYAQLPLGIRVTAIRIIDKRNIALSFDANQTQSIRELAENALPKQVIETDYFIVMREIPEELQQRAVDSLEDMKLLTFTDFDLCDSKVDEEHVLYSSSRV